MRRRLQRLARTTYLGLLVCPEELAWQEPACERARASDLLYFLVPIIGFLLFIEAIRTRQAPSL